MRKWVPVAVGALLVVLIVAVTHLWTRLGNQREIERLRAEADEMRELRDTVFAAVRLRDSVQIVLMGRVAELTAAADRMRDQVAEMERERRASQLAVHALDSEDALQAEFASTYPELAPRFRRTALRPDPQSPELQYGMVPVWGFAAFVTYRRNADSYQRQADSLQQLDVVNQQAIAYKDTLFKLEHANRQAFQLAFDTTHARYMDLNERFRQHLAQPRFGLNVPRWPILLLTLGGGVYLGSRIE